MNFRKKKAPTQTCDRGTHFHRPLYSSETSRQKKICIRLAAVTISVLFYALFDVHSKSVRSTSSRASFVEKSTANPKDRNISDAIGATKTSSAADIPDDRPEKANITPEDASANASSGNISSSASSPAANSETAFSVPVSSTDASSGTASISVSSETDDPETGFPASVSPADASSSAASTATADAEIDAPAPPLASDADTIPISTSAPGEKQITDCEFSNRRQNGSVMVWITKRGSKFHRKKACGRMSAPIQITEEEALKRGLSPCTKCIQTDDE